MGQLPMTGRQTSHSTVHYVQTRAVPFGFGCAVHSAACCHCATHMLRLQLCPLTCFHLDLHACRAHQRLPSQRLHALGDLQARGCDAKLKFPWALQHTFAADKHHPWDCTPWQVAHHPRLSFAATTRHIIDGLRKLSAVATPEEVACSR